MTATEIQSMSVAERLAAIEMLWSSLDEYQRVEAPTPAWHEGVLSDRMTKIRSGEATFSSAEDVFKRLKK